MYYVYILWSFKSKIFYIYTGYTENLKKRIEEHNGGISLATKVLKNGDLIEVDSNKGIVKIIERGK